MINNWNISGLILEGISGTGKTAIFSEIVRTTLFTEKPYLSSIILSEHQTQRILEKKFREQGLTREDNLSVLNTHVNYLESLNERLDHMDWCNKKIVDMRIPYIFERFHLTHVYQYEHMKWKDVAEIDKRLVDLNGKLCLLLTDREKLAERLFNKPEPTWHNYLKRFGSSEEEIVEHFYGQQDELLELAEKSNLPVIRIDTSKKGIKKTVSEIFSLWDLSDPVQ